MTAARAASWRVHRPGAPVDRSERTGDGPTGGAGSVDSGPCRPWMGPAGFEPEARGSCSLHYAGCLWQGSDPPGDTRHCSLLFTGRVGPAGFEPKADVLASLRATAKVRIRSASHTRSLRSRCSMGPAGFEPATTRCPIPRGTERPRNTTGKYEPSALTTELRALVWRATLPVPSL